ncbi:MAG: hypothetical protein IJQ34_06870 [Kiritimatiellae bacterium]|nr:hypothetical protein [Kiritimatiellia bacterium]
MEADQISEVISLGKRPWYLLHTKPRAEKKIAEWLKFYHYFYHLPTYIKRVKVQRRKVKRIMPLFPGYEFARLLPEERLNILKTNLLVRTIFIAQPRVVIHQLRQIKNATKHRPIVKVSHSFKAGDKVKILYGPMRGVEGVVKREGPQATLCLNVDILGTCVEVAISPEELEAAKVEE